MKNKLLQTLLLVCGVSVFLLGCDQTKKPNTQNKNLNDTVSTMSAENYKTKYTDGRITEVRELRYYNFYKDTIKANRDDKLKLIAVITEWNKYEALVADTASAFTQLPSNFMAGGDVETNERIKKSTVKYFDIASKMFEKEFITLKLSNSISNRDTNYVTIDFLTNKGFYTVQELKSKLEQNQSVWSNVFEESKKLSNEIEKTVNSNEWKKQ
jgi:hypothetical protein